MTNAELWEIIIIGSDEYYELKGYHQYNPRDISKSDLIDELKTYLMDIFCKLENAERRIFRKHRVDARGKLNYKNFNHK